MSIEEVASDRVWGMFGLGCGAARLDEPPEILESMPMAIYACDAQGRLLWFNNRAVQIWGRTPRLGDDSENTAVPSSSTSMVGRLPGTKRQQQLCCAPVFQSTVPKGGSNARMVPAFGPWRTSTF
jgi:hypothetical protein